LKLFFEYLAKIYVKNFPFSKEICKFEKGKNFASGSASFEISVTKNPFHWQCFSRKIFIETIVMAQENQEFSILTK
jgi:hypothetical protein